MPDDLQIPELGKRKVFGSTLPMPGMPEVPAAAMSKTPMSLGMTPSSPPNPFDEAIQKGLAINAASSPSLPPSPLPKPPMAAAGDQPQPPGIQPKPFFSAAERNIKNPFLRKLAEVGDVAGGILAPRIESMIPGSRGAEQAAQNRELGIEKEQAGIGKTRADSAKEAEETRELPDKAALERAQADELKHKAAEQPKINPQEGYAAAITDAIQRGVDPNQDPHVQAWKTAIDNIAKQKTETFEEQEYDEWKKAHPSGTRLQFEQERARDTQKPEHDPRQLGIVNGEVVELKPGMKVPDGATDTKGNKIGVKATSADEQKRADLAENLNENLDQLEEIVNRRGDLFGKVAGRETKFREWLGSNDPDVAALKGIEDRLGMVAQSSHGMRSAQHVEQSANSILNGFKNGPDAMKRAISDARKSAATFTQDAQRGSVQPGGAPKPGDVVDGYRFKGGNPADQKSWEPVK